MKFSKQSKTSLISFIITFFASLILFVFAAMILSKSLPNLFKSSDSDDPDNSLSANVDIDNVDDTKKSDDTEITGDNFSILVAGMNISGDSFEAMIILDIDKTTQKMTLYPLNTDADICIGENEKKASEYLYVKLSDLYRFKNDMNYICEKIHALTALNITNYVTFTAEDFIKAVDILNENKVYTYTVQKDMFWTYSDEPELAKYNIDFKKGDKLTSGIDIYNMLRYKGDSVTARMDRQTSVARDMTKALISSQFENKSATSAISTFTSLLTQLKNCKTNISPEDFITNTFDLITKINSFGIEVSQKFKSTESFLKPIATN